jgi:16S rRNA (cytosine967-C5)-methyltransferase
VTCSLLDCEGSERIARFLVSRAEWNASLPPLSVGRVHGTGWRLTPFHDGTDGFFIADLDSPC